MINLSQHLVLLASVLLEKFLPFFNTVGTENMVNSRRTIFSLHAYVFCDTFVKISVDSVKIFRMDELITPGVSGTLYYIQW